MCIICPHHVYVTIAYFNQQAVFNVTMQKKIFKCGFSELFYITRDDDYLWVFLFLSVNFFSIFILWN